ncbi:Ribosomal large subunit pseudouridine synthase A [gamma proteobacterium IMCC2047]|nr:Ribosomal large subunit pseudouridine synthase A [gamma proteobacterium IMCC2047]
MQAIGHPILGDEFYANPDALAAAEQLQLHAAELGFKHPVSHESRVFTCEPPFKV